MFGFTLYPAYSAELNAVFYLDESEKSESISFFPDGQLQSTFFKISFTYLKGPTKFLNYRNPLGLLTKNYVTY